MAREIEEFCVPMSSSDVYSVLGAQEGDESKIKAPEPLPWLSSLVDWLSPLFRPL